MQGLISPHMESSRVPHHIPGVSSSLISQPLLMDSQVPYGRLQHPLTHIYPIDQMRSSHVENDYIDSPAVISQQPPGGGGQKSAGGGGSGRRAITWLGQSQQQQQQDSSGAFLGANHNHHHNHQQQHGRCEAPGRQDATTHPWISFSGRPSSISSSSSTSSDQRLLDHAAPTPTLDPHLAPHPHHHHPHQGSLGGSAGAPARTLQGCFMAAAPPTSSSSSPADPKVLTTASSSSSSICSSSSKSQDLKASNATAGVGGGGGGVCGGQPRVSALTIPSSPAEKKHLALMCERCGKCRCTECTLPRALPSCWVCNQECLCSAQSLVDSATCMCLVRGVFYHCAEDEDDEGSCADRPCSCCSQANCCARWSFMAALSVVLPCLLCYLPATGAAKLGQRCYDSARRPGCRCKQGPAGAGAAQGCKSGGGGGGGGGVEGKAPQGTTEKQQQGS